MNHHVNNVKYVNWTLETIPDQVLESHQLSSIILEYRTECGSSDIVQSLCEPDDQILVDGVLMHISFNTLNGFPLAPEILNGHGLMRPFDIKPLHYTHLLKIEGETKNEEIVRGRTKWKKKPSKAAFS